MPINNNKSLTLDPDKIRTFSREYENVSKSFESVHKAITEAREALKHDASKYTVSQQPMPGIKETVLIIDAKLAEYSEFLDTLAKKAVNDAKALTDTINSVQAQTQEDTQKMRGS